MKLICAISIVEFYLYSVGDKQEAKKTLKNMLKYFTDTFFNELFENVLCARFRQLVSVMRSVNI